MATIKEGTVFQQAWNGCRKPMTFEVLEVDRERDYLKVLCIDTKGFKHEEEWEGPGDGLEFTENCIDIGEYKLISN